MIKWQYQHWDRNMMADIHSITDKFRVSLVQKLYILKETALDKVFPIRIKIRECNYKADQSEKIIVSVLDKSKDKNTVQEMASMLLHELNKQDREHRR